MNKEKTGNFLEVSAYPSKHLWYFFQYYGYKPRGIEYVEWAAHDAQEMLDSVGFPTYIIMGDFFVPNPADHLESDGWNVVASFGFVEHFAEPEIAISRHLDVIQEGGLVVISTPNHYGWNKNILKAIDQETSCQHNRKSLPDMIDAFNETGNNEILFSGYVGHIGFWNTTQHKTAKEKLGVLYPTLRAPLWVVEKLGCWLVPNNRISFPEILVIARKHSGDHAT